MKSYEQYKRIVRFLFSAILVSVEMAMYWHVWLKYYNGLMEFPYNRTGNWLIVAVYGIFLIVFSMIYGGFRIGYLRIFNIIFSQTLVSSCANAFSDAGAAAGNDSGGADFYYHMERSLLSDLYETVSS